MPNCCRILHCFHFKTPGQFVVVSIDGKGVWQDDQRSDEVASLKANAVADIPTQGALERRYPQYRAMVDVAR